MQTAGVETLPFQFHSLKPWASFLSGYQLCEKAVCTCEEGWGTTREFGPGGPKGEVFVSELLFQTLRFSGLMQSPSCLWSGHRTYVTKSYSLQQELKKCYFMIMRMSMNNEIGSKYWMKLPKKKKKKWASSRKMTSKAFDPERYKGSLKKPSHPRRLHRVFSHIQFDTQMYLNVK